MREDCEEVGDERCRMNEFQHSWKKMGKEKRNEAKKLLRWLAIAAVIALLALLSLVYL